MQIALTTVPTPPKMGNVRLRIEVKDASAHPVVDAKVEVSVGHARDGGAQDRRPTAKGGRGRMKRRPISPMGGTWTAEVTASRPQGGSKSAKFHIEVK